MQVSRNERRLFCHEEQRKKMRFTPLCALTRTPFYISRRGNTRARARKGDPNDEILHFPPRFLTERLENMDTSRQERRKTAEENHARGRRRRRRRICGFSPKESCSRCSALLCSLFPLLQQFFRHLERKKSTPRRRRRHVRSGLRKTGD